MDHEINDHIRVVKTFMGFFMFFFLLSSSFMLLKRIHQQYRIAQVLTNDMATMILDSTLSLKYQKHQTVLSVSATQNLTYQNLRLLMKRLRKLNMVMQENRLFTNIIKGKRFMETSLQNIDRALLIAAYAKNNTVLSVVVDNSTVTFMF